MDRIKVLHTLLGKSGLMDHKYDLLSGYGAGSSKDLTPGQADELIAYLQGRVNDNGLSNAQYAAFDKDNYQHKYILSLAIQVGWVRFNKKLQRAVADLDHLGAWLRKYAAVKKPLRKMDKRELQQVIFQLERLLTKHFKK